MNILRDRSLKMVSLEQITTLCLVLVCLVHTGEGVQCYTCQEYDNGVTKGGSCYQVDKQSTAVEACPADKPYCVTIKGSIRTEHTRNGIIRRCDSYYNTNFDLKNSCFNTGDQSNDEGHYNVDEKYYIKGKICVCTGNRCLPNAANKPTYNLLSVSLSVIVTAITSYRKCL